MRRQSLKLAYVQHPMVLLVHEDRGEPPVGERVAPWGAPDLPTYAERVRRNLRALQEFPDLLLNYEFSGVEMEMLATVAPDTVDTMREMAAKGRLAFVGGDYSQPHGHLFSGELNYRQLEIGLRVFAELVGYRVTCAFHQETCAHDQMPQLLRAFGFESAVPPDFTHTIIPLSLPGPSLIADGTMRGYRPVARDSAPRWSGLDGTTIPLVIPGIFRNDEYHRGLYRISDLCLDAPDLNEVEESRVERVRGIGEFVLLDAQAREEIGQHPPSWDARLVSYWSYSEGQWAEAMYRGIRSTESQLLAEETLHALYGSALREELDADWRTVLAAMHHDVHWIEVIHLKRTYLQRLEAVASRSREASARLVGLDGNRAQRSTREDTLAVINTLPLPRHEVVILRAFGSVPRGVERLDGRLVPSQCVPAREAPGKYDMYFVAELPACGVASYRLVDEGATVAEEVTAREAACQAGQTRYSVLADGTVREAVLPSGVNVLRAPGHDLRYLSEHGELVGGPDRPGTLLLYQGPVGDVIRVSAPVGDVPTEIEFLASPAIPHLEIWTCFTFDRHHIGVMWEDWTKLNTYWPTWGDTIRHDIPFGVIDGREGLPLYAPSWVSACGTRGGLAVINTGTPKHYVEDGTIASVLAWGGAKYTNRMHADFWLTKDHYDLSLHGRQDLHWAVHALPARHEEVDVARIAQRVNCPPLVFSAVSGTALPQPSWSLDLSQTSLVSSALFRNGSRPACRFYECGGAPQTVQQLKSALGLDVEVTDLAGVPLEVIGPYRIGYIILPMVP
jgi:hypothetical protein